MSGKLDLILLDREMYRLLKEKADDNERLVVYRGEKVGLTALGFADVINIDGTDITDEYGLPRFNSNDVGYGFNFNSIELKAMTKMLFEADVPDFDIASQNDRFAIFFFGNICFNPRQHVAFKGVT